MQNIGGRYYHSSSDNRISHRVKTLAVTNIRRWKEAGLGTIVCHGWYFIVHSKKNTIGQSWFTSQI